MKKWEWKREQKEMVVFVPSSVRNQSDGGWRVRVREGEVGGWIRWGKVQFRAGWWRGSFSKQWQKFIHLRSICKCVLVCVCGSGCSLGSDGVRSVLEDTKNQLNQNSFHFSSKKRLPIVRHPSALFVLPTPSPHHNTDLAAGSQRTE